MENDVRIHITDPVVLKNTALQAHTHGRINTDAVLDGTQAAAAAKVTARQFQIVPAYFLCSPGGKIF